MPVKVQWLFRVTLGDVEINKKLQIPSFFGLNWTVDGRVVKILTVHAFEGIHFIEDFRSQTP
jgi:hypothetical protein